MIVETTQLTEFQKNQITRLHETCCRHDRLRLSYPLSEPDTRHYLLYPDSGSASETEPAAVLAILPYDDALAECIAFTHPDRRQSGYFTALLDAALARYEDYSLLFPVSGDCTDTLAALDALDAVLESRELQMSLDLDRKFPLSFAETCTLTVLPESDGMGFYRMEAAQSASLPAPGQIPGTCRTFRVSDTCVCLHHVEIAEALRGQGYGYAMLCLLLNHLTDTGYKQVSLQVSASNEAALALYKKTGFRVTETLSYYLY